VKKVVIAASKKRASSSSPAPTFDLGLGVTALLTRVRRRRVRRVARTYGVTFDDDEDDDAISISGDSHGAPTRYASSDCETSPGPHVDHGKTTLVDACCARAAFQRRAVRSSVMDSNDQERERGITILASASIDWKGVRINLSTRPGTRLRQSSGPDDGRRRVAARRPAERPSLRRLRLSKASARTCRRSCRQQGRPAPTRAPPSARRDRAALHGPGDGIHHLEFTSCRRGREGRAMIGWHARVRRHLARCSTPSWRRAGADGDPDAPLQALVTNLDASDYLGRLPSDASSTACCAAARPCPARRGDTEGQPPVRRRSLSSWRSPASDAKKPHGGPAICSSSPASPRSRSATPSRRGDPRPLLASWSTSRVRIRCVNTSPLAGKTRSVPDQPSSAANASTRGARQRSIRVTPPTRPT